MKVNAHVKNKAIHFGSPIAQERFFEQAEGKYIKIEIDDAPTANKRRFFEGCLVPSTFYAMPQSGWRNFQDAREALKAEFLPVKLAPSLTGHQKQVQIIPSTAELSNVKFGAFIESIVEWLRENRMVPEECLDPENYKAWKDSAPSPGSIYPPLARLKEVYDREKYGSPNQESDARK